MVMTRHSCTAIEIASFFKKADYVLCEQPISPKLRDLSHLDRISNVFSQLLISSANKSSLVYLFLFKRSSLALNLQVPTNWHLHLNPFPINVSCLFPRLVE